MSLLPPPDLVPGDWEAYLPDGSVIGSSLTGTWADFSTLQEIAGARLHVSKKFLRQVNIWTGEDWATLFPPHGHAAYPVFAYRWTRAPLIGTSDEEELYTYSYTGFGYIVGEMGVLMRVFINGGITFSTFFTSDPFPF